jgi:hypothetical protein
MNTTVTVTADDLGNVITQTLNPEIGYIKLEQKAKSINGNWIKNQKRTALIFGKMEDLTALDFKANQQLEGKIIVEESFIPFNVNNAERDIKMAGQTGIACHVDGQPIYRRQRYTNNCNEHDSYIQHSNTEEIKEALDAMKSLNFVLS